MGLKSPILLALNMTEQQQISRTQAAGKHDQNLTPRLRGDYRQYDWHGGKAISILWSHCCYITARLLQILSTSPTITATLCPKAAINRIASGRCGDARRHRPAGDEAGVNHYRRADLYLRTGAGGGRVPYVNRFCRLPDFGRTVDYRRHHLHRAIGLRLYRALGDISVLVFFGWLSVMGSWYLRAHTLIPALILPATACGLLATAVLNINNLRDINGDRERQKHPYWYDWAMSTRVVITPACC